MGDVDIAVSGQDVGGYRAGAAATDPLWQYVVPVPDRLISAYVTASTFKVTGAATNYTTTPLNLMSVENTAGSAVRVGVRRLVVKTYVTTAAAVWLTPMVFRLFRGTTVPTGTATATLHKTDTAMTTPPANVVVRGPASADGTAAAITYALPAGTPMKQEPHPAYMTAAGEAMNYSRELWTQDKPPLVLRAGESLIVLMTGATGTVNWQYSTEVELEVFTRP